jgi:hypothetical protein
MVFLSAAALLLTPPPKPFMRSASARKIAICPSPPSPSNRLRIITHAHGDGGR